MKYFHFSDIERRVFSSTPAPIVVSTTTTVLPKVPSVTPNRATLKPKRATTVPKATVRPQTSYTGRDRNIFFWLA